MQIIRNWALIICFASIACSMLEIMAPNGNMEKIMRFVFGIFMLCAVVNPLIVTLQNINLDIKTDNKDYTIEDFTDHFDTKVNEVAIDNIKEIIISELNLIDIKPRKVDVFMDMKDKDCISIKEITVTLDKKNSNKQEEVKKVLEKKLGIKINVAV